MRTGMVMLGAMGVFLLVVGGCPQPSTNGNSNQNTANANATANENTGDSNANVGDSNQNANTPGGNSNENAPANTNANTNTNTNENAGPIDNGNANGTANVNENASANANDNQNASANSNANTNTNTNENSNTNTNTNTNGSGGLSPAQVSIVEAAVNGATDLGAYLGVFSPVSNPVLDFDNLGSQGDFSNDCPIGFFEPGGANITVVYLEYSPGCSTADTNDEIADGLHTIHYNRVTHVGQVTVIDVAIGARTVSNASTMNLTMTGGGLIFQGGNPVGAEPVSANGTVDLLVGGSAISGTLQLVINALFVQGSSASRRTTINATDAAITRAGIPMTIDFANVLVDPRTEPNWTALGGTLTVDVAGEATLQIEFGADTPETGVVQVRVAGGNPIPHDVPGIGS